MNKSHASRENGFKPTCQEELQFNGADFNWDMEKIGRMVRITVESYDTGIYFFFKLFNLKTVFEDGR